MPYYLYFCNNCGHTGTRYHNVTECPNCGSQWSRKYDILLEAYPNIMPDLMGKAVREALDALREARGAG